ncbi:MAG: hypothetical protein GF308_00395 [Candidatus Heimdallarchaeota archaeon]|nr:hypothetical protein [Candidatus Heimdallarchaeota archaeon]
MAFEEENNKYQIILIIGTILGCIGAVAVIVGLFLEFDVITSSSGTGTIINTILLLIIGLLVGIFITCLISFIGAITPYGFNVTDERPSLIGLFLFVFAPTSFVTTYSTPMYLLLEMGTDALSLGIGFGFYITFVGIAFSYIAFVLLALIFIWKRFSRTESSPVVGGLDLSDLGVPGGLRITGCILAILAAIAVILGLALPTYSMSGQDVTGLFLRQNGYLDLGAIFLALLMLTIIIIAFLTLLSNLNVLVTPKNDLPLLLFLLIPLVLPGYTPESSIFTAPWSTPVMELGYYLLAIFANPLTTISVFGWILLVSLVVLVLTIPFNIMAYFFEKTSTHEPRPARAARGVPTSPPSAPASIDDTTSEALSGPPSGEFTGLASELTEPSTPSGPPSATETGQQPVVTSEPPTPPSFMSGMETPAEPTPKKDEPTCPFCGKALSFIEQYQRWYCYSCEKYV